MKNVPATKLGDMYREHINLILDKDIDGLLNQYSTDAVLISSFEKVPKIFRGHTELKDHFQGILGIEGLETDIAFWAETDPSVGTRILLIMGFPFSVSRAASATRHSVPQRPAGTSATWLPR